jgi:aryl-alcohol dehydrogenase-like predicted oxidoreductase
MRLISAAGGTTRSGESGPASSSIRSGTAGPWTSTFVMYRPMRSPASPRPPAARVRADAAELGVTPAQVAIAWTRTRSPAVHPIIGARRPGQLLDNLRAADLELPAEAVARLDTATSIDLGFPATFIRETSPWVFGAAAP